MTSVRVNSYRVGMLVATFVLVHITFGESQVFGQGGGIVLSGLGDSISMSNIDVTGPRGIPTTPTAVVSIGFDLMGNPITPMEGTATESAQNLVNNLVSFIGQPPPNLTKWNDLQGDEMMMPIHVTLNQPRTVKFYTITSANDSPERDPHRWRLLGSTLENPTAVADFTLLDERDGIEFSAFHQTQLFGAIPNNTAYRTYRFEFETEWVAHMTGTTPNSIQLAEIELFENFAGGGLKMEINRGGAATDSTMTLISAATAPLQVLGYSIISNVGALNSTNWRSVADNADGNNGGTLDTDNWIELTETNGRRDLSEVENPDGTNGFTLNPGATLNLGNNAWIKNPTEDVTAEVLVLVDGQPVTQQVSVTFTGQAAYRFGDLNFDRNVTAADWVAFKNGQGTNFTQVFSAAESYAKGDLDGDLDHDLSDFVVFKTTFDAANGAGAFQAMLASIPEPSSALLLIAGAALGTFRRIRRRGALVILLVCMLCHAGAEVVHAQTVLPGLVGSDLTDPDNMAPLAVGIVAEGTFPANEQPPAALDNNTGTKWLSFLPNGAFYQVQFSSGGQSAVNRYTITSANDAPERDPYSWTLTGSNDGTNFTTVDTRSAQEFDARFQTRDYTFTNTAQYAFYRFNFQTELGAGGPNAGAPNSLQLAEIELFGTPVTGLTLEVNAATGAIRIANNTTGPISLDAYEIRSAAGSLNRDNWWGGGSQAAKNGGQSIHDQTITGFPSGTIGNGNGWEEGPGSTDNEISEWFLGPGGVGTSALAAGEAITMNNVFRAGSAQDLTFDYRSVGAPFRASVTYIGAPVGVTGDYNGNGTVDAADYVLWRNGGPLQNDPTNGVQPEDYNVWRANFGRTPAGGAALGDTAAVPEPTGLLLALLVPGLLSSLRWRRAVAPVVCQNRNDLQPILRRNAMVDIAPKRGLKVFCAAAGSLLLSGVAVGSTLDRNYRLGDDAQENAVAGQVVGTASALAMHTLDSAPPFSFQDLMQNSGPTYVNVQTLGRPGVTSPQLGVQFNGTNQYLQGNGLGSPREGAAVYGAGVLCGTPGKPCTDYGNDRLMQLWVRPTANTAGRQDVISDTFQFGVFISDTDMWGHVYGSDTQAPPEQGDSYVTNSPVAYNQWTHIMQRTFDNDSVALYVNGVAVSRFNDNYTEVTGGTGDLNMYVGAASGGSTNFFTGQVDDIKLHVAGIYTPMANPIPVDWGAVNLGTENDFIASRNLVAGDVNGDGVVNGTGTGPVATDDVSFFIDHWLDQRTVNGFVMGDLTSRTTMGDLNFDGRTSLADWAILRGAHAAGASLDLGALLGASIPEPSTAAIAGFALTVLGASVRRRRNGTRVVSRICES